MARIARSPFWLFLLITLAITWPLAARSARSLASDYGDPLFTAWAMGWVSSHVTAALRADWTTMRGFWDANIFFPEPNTLAFSDHMVAEAVEVLPLYWATGNLLLGYNAALILSFALCGYGGYLLVRELTGSAAAAFAAGVFFAFNEYRLTYELSHLQSLSIHWLPFALIGFYRFAARGSRAALGGGATALVLLNLSAGFHMLYCAPFVAGFVALALWRHGRLGDARAWRDLSVAAGAVAAGTLPFAYRYVLMQRQLRFDRQLDEVIRFSATLDHYRAALPGFAVPLALAAVAVAMDLRPRIGALPRNRGRESSDASRGRESDDASRGRESNDASRGRESSDARQGRESRESNDATRGRESSDASRGRESEVARRGRESRESNVASRGRESIWRESIWIGAAALGAILTFWLSLGPVIQAGGHTLPVPGIYHLLYNYLPGFRGLRAAGRFAMLFFFFLAILGGFGVAALERRSRRTGQAVAAIACAVFLWQTRPVPFPLDREWPFVSAGLAPVPAYLHPGPSIPPVYRFLATLDQTGVIVEFPFGDNAYDLRYMFFSAAHHRRMLGGFSGVFPDSWIARRGALEHPLASPDAAWSALDGATDAIVHTRGWPDDTGLRICDWLRAHGAREAAAFDDAHVFELRR